MIDEALTDATQLGEAGCGLTLPPDDEGGGSDKWTLVSWAKGTGVHRAVAAALQPPVAEGGYQDEAALNFLRGMKHRSQLEKLLAKPEALRAMADLVWFQVVALQQAAAATTEELQSKFSGAIQLSYSGLSTFFSGLEGIVGGPNPKVAKGMEEDHLHGADADSSFVTGNYGINTTSRIEWLFVTDEEATPEQLGLKAWPAESEEKLPDRSRCRVRRPLAEMEKAAKAPNDQLKRNDHTPLGQPELIAANLYTGPVRAPCHPPAPSAILSTTAPLVPPAALRQVQRRAARPKVQSQIPAAHDGLALLLRGGESYK